MSRLVLAGLALIVSVFILILFPSNPNAYAQAGDDGGYEYEEPAPSIPKPHEEWPNSVPTLSQEGLFPIKGPFIFGESFGALRGTRSHTGQDIIADEGTPVVAPRPGIVVRRAFQRNGAGQYLVIKGDDGRDYVFMHLKRGSALKRPSERVRAGESIAGVGSTGRSTGSHLHLEIWTGGWGSPGSPIDPLPELRIWQRQPRAHEHQTLSSQHSH